MNNIETAVDCRRWDKNSSGHIYLIFIDCCSWRRGFSFPCLSLSFVTAGTNGEKETNIEQAQTLLLLLKITIKKGCRPILTRTVCCGIE